MIYYNPYELYHHGIKGQKWGVRRFQNRDGTYTPLGRKRRSDDYNDDYEKIPRDYTKAKKIAKGVAKGVAAAALITTGAVVASSILSSPAGQKAITNLAKKAADPKTREKIKSVAKRKALRVSGSMVDAALASIGTIAVAKLVSKIDTSTPQGQVAVRVSSEGIRELTRTNYKNSNFNSNSSGSKVDKNSKEYQDLFKNQNGGIRSEDERKKIKQWVNDGLSLDQIHKRIDDELEHSDELYHHGIKGQKWGVRRFQNKDGSLKPAGEKRYYGNSTSKSAESSSSSSGKSRKPGVFSSDNPNAERNKKIAKAVAITAGVAAVSVTAFCVAKRVNSGMKEANKLIANAELRKHMLSEAQYHRDAMKDLMERDRTKTIDAKYGAETIRNSALLRDKALLGQKEWNLNLAKQHYNMAERQLAEGRADKRIGKYISKAEAARAKSQQRADQQAKGKRFQQAQYLMKQVAQQQGLADSKMYARNKSVYSENARRGREQLEALAKDPSIASMLKSYASSVNLPGMKELAEDILRKGA